MSIEFYNGKREANEYAKRKNAEGFTTRIYRDPKRDWIYHVEITGRGTPTTENLDIKKAIDLNDDNSNIEEVARSTSNRELLDKVNKAIDERRNYGQRKEVAEKDGYIFVWSNNSGSWYPRGDKTRKGELLNLDANQIFVPGISRAEALDLINSKELKDLPLYGGSYEKREKRELNFRGTEIPPALKKIHDNPELREKAAKVDSDLEEAFKEKDMEN